MTASPPPSDRPTSDQAPATDKALAPEELGYVFGEDEAELASYRRLQRRLGFSVLFSAAVVIFAVGMMVSMFGDLRYFFTDDADPIELSLVDVLEKPGSLEPWLDKYVALSATPDMGTAVKVSLGKDGKVTQRQRFFRLLEAGNRVFVQTDVAPTESGPELSPGLSTQKLQGRFVGRVYRLGKLGFFPQLRDHYNALARPELFDVPKDEWSKLDGQNLGLSLAVKSVNHPELETRTLTLRESDQVEVVVDAPEWMVQMGTRSWPDEDKAIERVASLGLPFVHVPYKPTPRREGQVQGIEKQLYHSFWLRPDSRSQAQIKAALDEGLSLPKDNASLELGSAVLPRRRTYLVRLKDLAVKGDHIRFSPISRSVSPGFELSGQTLVERSWQDDGISLPLSELSHLRITRPVLATRDSLILLTDSPPSGQWPSALGFVILAILALGNVVMGLRFFRRYQSLREDTA